MPFWNIFRRKRSANRKALVLYATDDTYGEAVVVFVRLLKILGFPEDVDIVTLHLHLSPSLVDVMKQEGILTRSVQELNPVKNQYYRHSLVKLRLLQLSEYERVVYADVDAIPLKRLDFLFSMPLDSPIAAPSATWIKQPFWTSALLVAKPSGELWTRAEAHFPHAYDRDFYDMDIINEEFQDEIQTLPDDAFCLNSEWEEEGRPGFFADKDEAYRKVAVVHFTALGKPWSFTTEEVRRLRPDAHPVFYELWEKWRRTRAEIF